MPRALRWLLSAVSRAGRYEAALAKAPTSVEYETMLMALRLRKEMLEMNVEAGILTIEAYLQVSPTQPHALT